MLNLIWLSRFDALNQNISAFMSLKRYAKGLIFQAIKIHVQYPVERNNDRRDRLKVNQLTEVLSIPFQSEKYFFKAA